MPVARWAAAVPWETDGVSPAFLLGKHADIFRVEFRGQRAGGFCKLRVVLGSTKVMLGRAKAATVVAASLAAGAVAVRSAAQQAPPFFPGSTES